jgi:hypothetical protein
LPINEPFIVGGEEMMFPHAPGAPADQVINCVVEGETVFPIGDLESIARAWWQGPTIQFVSADGISFKVTPNHPILTATGMKAAHLINIGEQIINVRLPIHDPQNQNRIATVEELYRASRVTGRPLIADARGMNFHNDVIDEDVNVVWPDRELGLSPERAQRLDRVRLMRLGDTVSLVSGSSNSEEPVNLGGLEVIAREPARLIDWYDPATGFPVCFLSLPSDLASLIESAVGESDQVRFGTGTGFDAVTGKTAYDHSSGGVEFVGDGEDALAGVVSFDQIVSIDGYSGFASDTVGVGGGQTELFASALDRAGTASVVFDEFGEGHSAVVSLSEVVEINVEVSGHWVYNLTSSSGLLWSPFGVHSNCRCMFLELYPGDVNPETGELIPEGGEGLSFEAQVELLESGEF